VRVVRFGLVITVSIAAIAAVPVASASAATRHTIAISTSPPKPIAGHPVTVAGTVSPNAHGQTVALQQRHGTNPWVTVKTMQLGAASRYRFLRFMNAPGIFQLRTKLGNNFSKAKTISVYKVHFFSDLTPTSTSGGCITNGSAQIRTVTYAHTVSLDLTCGSDVWANYNLKKGCYLFDAVWFFTNASSSDAQATLSVGDVTRPLKTLTVAESDFSAPGKRLTVPGAQTVRLEANAASGTTPIAAFGNASVTCTW
jgi:hypothetical protein